jgi:hypothetical protein
MHKSDLKDLESKTLEELEDLLNILAEERDENRQAAKQVMDLRNAKLKEAAIADRDNANKRTSRAFDLLREEEQRPQRVKPGVAEVKGTVKGNDHPHNKRR